jgi:phosphopantetheinyl transferase
VAKASIVIAEMASIETDPDDLDFFERESIQRATVEKARRERKASYAFARDVLSRRYSIPRRDLKIQRTDLGKPALSIGGKTAHYSISHSAGLIAIAVSDDCQLGLDLQIKAPFNPSIFARILTDKENLQAANMSLLVSANSASEDFFFVMWTLKEAALKCIGTGFAVPMRAMDCFPIAHQPTFKTVDIQIAESETPAAHRHHATKQLYGRRIDAGNEYVAHLVWAREYGELEVELTTLR